MAEPTTRRAGRLETLGAWLHVWTPRRGVDVRPAPWRAIGIGAVVAVAALIAVVAALSGDTKRAEKRRTETLSRQEIAAAKRERARLVVEQAPRRARAKAGPPSRATQSALVGALEHSITRDAAARFKRHQVSSITRDTVCIPFVRPAKPQPPPPPLSAREGKYECVAVTGRVPKSQRTKAVISGYPFWARMDFRSGRYVWCKVNPRPAEHGTYDELAFVPPVPECDLLHN